MGEGGERGGGGEIGETGVREVKGCVRVGERV